MKLADTTASKAVGLTSVGVQVPPRPHFYPQSVNNIMIFHSLELFLRRRRPGNWQIKVFGLDQSNLNILRFPYTLSKLPFILKYMRTILLLGLLCLFMSSCAPKTSNVSEDGCYKIEGDEVIYTCNNDTKEEEKTSTPGYDGPNNPKALNLYRPGRFENMTGW